MVNHVQSLSTMVNHCPMSHCDKDCLNMKINHGQPWSTMVNMKINDGQSWSSMVSYGLTSHYDKDCLNMKNNHGLILHYDKDYFNMKINHGQPCLF